MIHYHGTPLSGATEQQILFYRGRHALISWPSFGPIHIPITECCSSFCIDNGAFTFWKENQEVDWPDFYSFVMDWVNHPRFDFFIIPDVIGGTVEENDALIEEYWSTMPDSGVPVFHVGEPLERIDMFILKYNFTRIAIGTTKGFELKSMHFWNEMRKIFEKLCINGMPRVKVHGLRMLDPEIVEAFPFSSVDSTTATRKATINTEWEGYPYAPISKAARATLVADRIEQGQSPSFYKFKPIQLDLI